MNNRDDLLSVLRGEKPGRIPYIPIGFWDEKTMHKLVPPDCWDENTYCIPSDEPPRERFSPEPRTADSRDRAVRMARYMDMATLGAGKGAVFPFGHGGPGEIQPVVIERKPEYKILQYEGGSRRKHGYNPHSIMYYNFPVQTEEDLETLELPDMKNPERFQDIEADCRQFKAIGFATTGVIQGFFSGIHNSFMSFQDTMVNLLLKPQFMERLTKKLAEMSLDAVDMLLDRGVEIINVCDDLGNADGLLMSPGLFRQFFLPWYDELTRRVHERGAFIHLHSHGNIASLLPDLAAIGIDIINPFDWEENPDLPELVKRFGKHFVFCGGCTGELYRHTLEEVELVIRRACGLSRLAERGYILSISGITDALSVDEWNAWRAVVNRAREEI
ncbi:MAG: hypothetical protein JXB06_07690 [Spirochaetales bacterium]|nr:hypothetical protein [Spirochaetales bacterium]